MVHADTGIGVSSMSDANTIQQEIDEEIHMLAHDLLEYPSAYIAQVVVQSVSAASPSAAQRVAGACKVVSNYQGAGVNLQNAISPEADAHVYFYKFERKKRIDTKDAKVTFLSQPSQGQISRKQDALSVALQ